MTMDLFLQQRLETSQKISQQPPSALRCVCALEHYRRCGEKKH